MTQECQNPVSLSRHVEILCQSYHDLTGQNLIDPSEASDPLTALDLSLFGVVSHGIGPDPVFNYANRAALLLFETTFEAFTRMPSRLSAEPAERNARSQLLERVARDGFIDDYAGIRISARGRRFRISGTTVWNLQDENGAYYGQAAKIVQWSPYFIQDGTS